MMRVEPGQPLNVKDIFTQKDVGNIMKSSEAPPGQESTHEDLEAVFSPGSGTPAKLILSAIPIFDQIKKTLLTILTFRHQTFNSSSYETETVFTYEYKYSAEIVFNIGRQLWLMLRLGTG